MKPTIVGTYNEIEFSSDELPGGLTLNESTGEISGITSQPFQGIIKINATEERTITIELELYVDKKTKREDTMETVLTISIPSLVIVLVIAVICLYFLYRRKKNKVGKPIPRNKPVKKIAVLTVPAVENTQSTRSSRRLASLRSNDTSLENRPRSQNMSKSFFRRA